MSDFVTVLPSAGRLMASLRDIGYDLPAALADLVDNSIDASARHIRIDLVADGAESWIRVVDDGQGMRGARLDEAMRYGTHTEYAEDALGHFGLGLKTASLSQCRRLTVASRGARGGRVAIRRWDLDEVVRRDSWDLEKVTASQADERLLEHFKDSSPGTVVLWENVDRVIPRRPTPRLTARVMTAATEEVCSHLAMVFHRFLSGEAFEGRNKVDLIVNDTPVLAWDPFARIESHTRALPSQVLHYEDSDERSISVEVRPYVLPDQHRFSTPDAHRQAGGPRRWNRHQGFYIYRRDRLIQAGGWNRLRTLDEHAKLARIAVDLPVGDEDRFAVDVAKMRVSIPEELRPGLRTVAAAAVAEAQQRYRDHLDASIPSSPYAIQEGDITPEAISISRDWPAILSVVDDVLGGDPALRDRLLLRLANADPKDAALLTGGG